MLPYNLYQIAGSDIFVTGSLGGLQLLNLTPEGNLHPRILSLGKDPLAERDLLAGLNADLYSLGQGSHSLTDALSFTIRRPLGYNHSILGEGVHIEAFYSYIDSIL